MNWALVVSRCQHHNGLPTPYKIKVNNEIDRFGDQNRVNSSNFNATILKFSEKFDHRFWLVFVFGNMFLESHGFVVSVTRSNNFFSCDRDKLEHVSLMQLVTGIATKPWKSGSMFPNIKTCRNRWSNFSANLRIVSLKLLELTRFLSPNQSI